MQFNNTRKQLLVICRYVKNSNEFKVYSCTPTNSLSAIVNKLHSTMRSNNECRAYKQRAKTCELFSLEWGEVFADLTTIKYSK